LGVTQTATGTIYVQVSGGNKTSQDFRVHIIVTSGQGSANPSDIQGSESGTTVTFSGSALYDLEPEGVYSYDVLNVFSHAYDMHGRKVLNENEWFGWVHWMRTRFRLGTIKEHWKQIQQSQWYDPTFEDFINKQVIAYVEREK
jgi:hypothetical protein